VAGEEKVSWGGERENRLGAGRERITSGQRERE
jgi:hypothetical protein